ncbi:MAG: FkbM family methyltransferase [Planctomycetota bacterium]
MLDTNAHGRIEVCHDMLNLQKYVRSIQNMGFFSFARYWWHQKSNLPRTGVFDLTSPISGHPLQCRAGTSDIDVFKHVYVLREYAMFDGLEKPGLIVDCGANVGMSTAYFLARHPGAQVIAVEPDQGNYRQLMHNTRHYGQRVRAVQAGVWSKDIGLNFVKDGFGDGRAWAIAVEEARLDEEPDLHAVSIPALLNDSGHDRIALLKVDIEGSELALFSEGAESWLCRVDHLVIELHGHACEQAFYKAIEPYDFEIEQSGGVVVCRSR